MQSVSCPVTSVSVTHLLAQQATFLQQTVWNLQNHKPTPALGGDSIMQHRKVDVMKQYEREVKDMYRMM